MFQEAYKAAMCYVYDHPWYVEVNMNLAAVVGPLFDSLQASKDLKGQMKLLTPNIVT